MRSVTALVAVALVAFVVGVCDTGSAGTGSASTGRLSSAGHAPPAQCPASALSLQPGAQVVPMTGEHAVMYALTNRGAATCTVSGYPKVVLYGAGGDVLPFRYAAGGGAYVTRAKPAPVVLAPGASAYILVAKYRCDLGTISNASAIRLTLPAADGGTFTRREALELSGPPGLSYCQGGPNDPGQQVTVSPVEPTQLAARGLR